MSNTEIALSVIAGTKTELTPKESLQYFGRAGVEVTLDELKEASISYLAGMLDNLERSKFDYRMLER